MPSGVVTLTLRFPVVLRLQVALTVVEVELATEHVLFAPETVTAVAPDRFVPVSVSAIAVPCVTGLGDTSVSVSPMTVKVCVPLVPPGVFTLTVLAVSPALTVIVKVAVIVVALTTVTALTLTPDPDTDTVVPVVVKLVPVSVTGTLVPRSPLSGVIDVSVGLAGVTTVNVTVLVVPSAAVVTLTFLALRVAEDVTVNVAVTVVSLTTVRSLEVTPEPEIVMAVAPVRPLPVRVTGTLVPRAPELGAIEVSTGPNTVNV